MAFTLDDGLNGLLDTLSARRDGADDDLTAWIDEIGPTALGELATTDEDVWTYFELLGDGSDEALEFIGGDSKYELTVGRACDRAEEAFVAWLDERAASAPLPVPGPRLRSSTLAERTLL